MQSSPTPPAEQVLTVPEPNLRPYLSHGFFRDNRDAILLAVGEHTTFLERAKAEEDPTHKQIIPYVVVMHEEKILAYRRTPQSGEARLHNKYSIGFGGHINDLDGLEAENTNRLFSGMIRELNEEVFLPGLLSVELIGFLNDDSNPVGRVHFGMVFAARLTDPTHQVNEPDLIEASWMTPAALRELPGELETWSALLLEGYFSDC